MQPGSFNDESLIVFLTELHDHLGARKATVIWDGLPSHRSRKMTAFVKSQRHWLVVERLPAYGDELNPVEQVWGNVKGNESRTSVPKRSATRHRPPMPGSRVSAATPSCASRSSGTAAFLYDQSVSVLPKALCRCLRRGPAGRRTWHGGERGASTSHAGLGPGKSSRSVSTTLTASCR